MQAATEKTYFTKQKLQKSIDIYIIIPLYIYV